MAEMSSFADLRHNVVSSQYCKILIGLVLYDPLLMDKPDMDSSLLSLIVINLTTRMNRSGLTQQPCLIPRSMLNQSEIQPPL